MAEKKQSDYHALKRSIAAGDLQSLYLLFGEDDALIEELVDLLRGQVLAPGAETLDGCVVDGQGKGAQLPIQQLFDDSRTPPFMSARRFILVKRSGAFVPGGLTDVRQQQLITLFEHLHDDVCVVFWEEKVDKRVKSLLAAVKKHGVVGEILHETPEQLMRWVRTVLDDAGVAADAEAVESLVQRCQSDMRQLRHELDKLLIYAGGASHVRLGLSDIDALCIPDVTGTIFDMTGALSSGQVDVALHLLNVLLERKESPQVILYMIARHLKQLIIAREADTPNTLMSQLHVPAFVAKQLMRQSKRFRGEVLVALYGLCFTTDQETKTGAMQPQEALEMLLVRGASAARAR